MNILRLSPAETSDPSVKIKSLRFRKHPEAQRTIKEESSMLTYG